MVAISTPCNAQQAIAQANRHERAKQIITEGYSFSDELGDGSLIAVCKPGRFAASYWIMDGECDCPDACKGNTCKHQQAWKLLQAEHADDTAMWEAQCARYDEEEGWMDGATKLPRFRALLHAELTDAENRARALHHEPFCKPSALQSWLNKAHRVKTALQTFDETLTKVQIGLLTL